MFFRLYRTRMKCLLNNKETIFWSFGFPIILALFFSMAFHNLTSDETINTIPIALIETENINNEFLNVLQSVEIAKDKKMFEVQTTSLETAEKLFQENKIKGYVDYNNNEANLYIKENGIEQSIIKTFLDSYMQKSQTIMNIVSLNPQAINNGVIQDTVAYQNYITDGSNNGKNPDFTIIYFYTLIALTCMFGSNWGFREMLDIQADQSAIGARINVAPTHKLKLLICNLLAALTLHLISILMLLAFLNYVLNVKFGSDIGMILITCIIGSLCGMSLGAMVCVTLKTNIKVREAILTTVSIGGGFLAGMMNVQMKYLIAEKAPIIGYVNPSSLITDIFYSLYYYDEYTRIYINLCMLIVLTFIFGSITYLKIRRRQYASI